jgi:hypothetical protein
MRCWRRQYIGVDVVLAGIEKGMVEGRWKKWVATHERCDRCRNGYELSQGGH